ncbi:hypothetical protein ACVMFA_007292 [Bradyrhizobium liaoningense]|uniref:Uncharacterized protein n=1 Tax=Bradyrhizobium japonicum TaxID=375 RepID=A0ABV2RH14_BRAJP|nr:hypothetical protein GCM10007858_62760 [Bradyrhizobium liaoningense]
MRMGQKVEMGPSYSKHLVGARNQFSDSSELTDFASQVEDQLWDVG